MDHLSLASLESLDTMSEADTPSGFTRGTRIRASLPVVRSTNQTKDRSLGMMQIMSFVSLCLFVCVCGGGFGVCCLQVRPPSCCERSFVISEW